MKNKYTPRRATKRWLKNAPYHILDIFKNKSGTYDVLYTGPLLYPLEGRTFSNARVSGREMSDNPCHPQGTGIWFDISSWEAAALRSRSAKRRVTWDSLPEKVKECAIDDGAPL